jgi:hypothetical protein
MFTASTAPMQAAADDGPGRTYNGGDEQHAISTPAGIMASAFKEEFFRGYYEYRKAGGDPAAFKEISSLEDAINAGEPFNISVPVAYPAASMARSLNPLPSYQAQINNYYCGPASAWVAMTHRGIGSNHFGASLNQPNLGTWYWLETDTYTATPRGENWRKTLNGWVDGTNDGWYVVHSYGSYAPAEDVASKFASNIDNSYAPVLNIWMNSSRGYLPGWTSGWGEVRHYVPGFGYAQYGDYLHYVEVFQPVGLGRKYNITKEFFAGILGGKGMIW